MSRKRSAAGNGAASGAASAKPWPTDCIWPEPSDEGYFWEAEDAESLPGDDTIDDLLEIKEYYDGLVQCGRLNDDYSLNEDYDEGWEDSDPDEGEEEREPFTPERGEDYWDDGFDLEAWTEDLITHLNLLKLPLPSPVAEIEQIIGYDFINENLLRQAFTRRSFGVEYETGDCERLEFIGDTVLNTVVTREMARQLTELDATYPHEPFSSSYSEGQLTQIRQHFVSGEYLTSRAIALGLDKYILYGSSERAGERGNGRADEETASETSLEDMMEAVLGAVAVDCNWDWYTLEAVVDKLLCVQLNNVSAIFRPNYYDTFNAWHQKHFGRMPDYEVSRGMPITPARNGLLSYNYHCTLRFSVPENDKGVSTSQRVDVQRETRSKARELAAEQAYSIVVGHGLWMRLDDAGIEPELENSINQLQELYQKKYIGAPEYNFEERSEGWYCNCLVNGIEGWGKAKSKTAAKKKAAFMVLVRLFDSAGLGSERLEKAMWKTME